MDFAALRAMCLQAQAKAAVEDAPVVLRLPGQFRDCQGLTQLWPGGPQGTVIAHTIWPRGLIADFSADDVLRHIDKFEDETWDGSDDHRRPHGGLST